MRRTFGFFTALIGFVAVVVSALWGYTLFGPVIQAETNLLECIYRDTPYCAVESAIRSHISHRMLYEPRYLYIGLFLLTVGCCLWLIPPLSSKK
jgi:hypothetical protein